MPRYKKLTDKDVLRAFREISSMLTAEVEYEKAFLNCLKLLVDLFEARGGAIMTLVASPSGTTMNLAYKLPPDYALKTAAAARTGLKISNSPSGIVLRSGKYYVMEDPVTDYRFKLGRALAREAGYKNLLYVPIVIKNRVLGTFVIYGVKPWTKDKIDFVSTIAEQAAVTLENIRLYHSIEQKVKTRTAELQGKIDELERFSKLTVGRELKMVELKEEIEALRKELKKYTSPVTKT